MPNDTECREGTCVSQFRDLPSIGRALLSVLWGDLELVSYRGRKRHFHHTSGWGLLPVAEHGRRGRAFAFLEPLQYASLGPRALPGVFCLA